MNDPRYGHGLTQTSNGLIFAISGMISTQSVDSFTTKCEKYSISEDKWTAINECLYPGVQASVCAFDDRYIYKFGGYSNHEAVQLNRIERYSLEHDCWVDIPFKSYTPLQSRSYST